MISEQNYKSLKEKFGSVSSWAIWNTNYTASEPKLNNADLSVFNSPNLLDILNTGFVFVGLNVSGTHGDISKNGPAWYNFHSGYARQNDYKLRYALQGTRYWGSYISDIIKHYPEVDSNNVRRYLNRHPEVVEENVEEFKQELALLGERPVLVALGTATYDILCKYLKPEYKVAKIKHYSYTIGKENYRDEVLKELDKF